MKAGAEDLGVLGAEVVIDAAQGGIRESGLAGPVECGHGAS